MKLLRHIVVAFGLLWSGSAFGADTFAGPIKTYSCGAGYYASVLASGGATTCLDAISAPVANLINLGLAYRTQTAFGPKPDLSAQAAAWVENGRALSELFDEQRVIGCIQFPALTGDVTTTAGSCATTSTLHKISTQTVSAGASIAWTGLGSTYNDYFGKCFEVFPATSNDNEYVQFGEGGTPTWKTTGYDWSGVYTGANSATVNGLNHTNDTGIDFSTGGSPNDAAESVSFTFHVFNLPSVSSVVTTVDMSGILHTNTTTYTWHYGGSYSGDTTAKTAIRLIAKTTNISGTCSLWGIVNS